MHCPFTIGLHAGEAVPLLTAQRLRGGFTFEAPRPIAFFPGTFDPFTLSHKAIVRTIRDRGFEVLLAIDEFSWSKRTQPYRIRRRIAAMSVADEFHVQIFPEDFPVNIANPENLHRLRQAFPGRKVSIAVGSDVVAHASSYRKPWSRTPSIPLTTSSSVGPVRRPGAATAAFTARYWS